MARSVEPEIREYRNNYIRNNFSSKSYSQMAQHLRVSEGYVRNLASKMRLRRNQSWTETEKEFIATHTFEEVLSRYGKKYEAKFLRRKHYNFQWKKKNAQLKANRNSQILEEHLGKEIVSKLKSR